MCGLQRACKVYVACWVGYKELARLMRLVSSAWITDSFPFYGGCSMGNGGLARLMLLGKSVTESLQV